MAVKLRIRSHEQIRFVPALLCGSRNLMCKNDTPLFPNIAEGTWWWIVAFYYELRKVSAGNKARLSSILVILVHLTTLMQHLSVVSSVLSSDA
jgi:hypothetical protein